MNGLRIITCICTSKNEAMGRKMILLTDTQIELCLGLFLTSLDAGKTCVGDPRRRTVNSNGKYPVGNRGVLNGLFPSHILPLSMDSAEPDLMRRIREVGVDMEKPC